jgi:hypothetical protein
MRTLTAGPWVGEFGFELFFWQGHLRAFASKYEHVIVAGRAGHEALYTDFCHEYRPFIAPTSPCIALDNYGNHAYDIKGAADTIFKDVLPCDQVMPCVQSWQPMVALFYPFKGNKVIPEYVMFGTQSEANHYDLVLATRHVKFDENDKLKPEWREGKKDRNWGIDNWMTFVNAFTGLRICSIGAPDSSLHVPGTDDLRGIALAQLADVLASSTAVVGASSGTMHLASLCGCPQIVWMGERNGGDFLVDRFYTDWNPFGTRVCIATRYDWRPSADYMIEATRCSQTMLPKMPARPPEAGRVRVRHGIQIPLESLVLAAYPFTLPRVTNY